MHLSPRGFHLQWETCLLALWRRGAASSEVTRSGQHGKAVKDGLSGTTGALSAIVPGALVRGNVSMIACPSHFVRSKMAKFFFCDSTTTDCLRRSHDAPRPSLADLSKIAAEGT